MTRNWKICVLYISNVFLVSSSFSNKMNQEFLQLITLINGHSYSYRSGVAYALIPQMFSTFTCTLVGGFTSFFCILFTLLGTTHHFHPSRRVLSTIAGTHATCTLVKGLLCTVVDPWIPPFKHCTWSQNDSQNNE